MSEDPGRQSTSPSIDLIERYMPPDFLIRIPPADRAWRGRIILLLWALGYPLAMAWSFGLTDDEGMVAFYRHAIAGLDDDRLVAELEATADVRGDGSEFSFWSLGST